MTATNALAQPVVFAKPIRNSENDPRLGRYPAANLITLTVDVIEECNLACRLCYTESAPSKHLRMPYEVILRLMERVRPTLKNFVFSGGEPFLREDIQDLAQRAAEIFPSVSILTNGTLITDANLEWLRSARITLGISLDGPRPVHDRNRGPSSFSRTVSSMVATADAGVPFAIQTILGEFGTDGLDYMVDLANATGAYGVFFQRPKLIGRAKPGNAVWRTPAEYKQIVEHVHCLQQANPHLMLLIKDSLYNVPNETLHAAAVAMGGNCTVGGCKAGLTYLYVCANGDVRMCPFIPITLGNLYRDDIFDIWHGASPLATVRDPSSYKVCGTCKNFNVCRGCRAEALAWNGDLMGEDPLCWTKQ